ncbi:MAG TPA: MarR family transcriptional regulator [Hydrogenophaga sp.]|jgi:DNA-binding MarR family transcriptional regulator|uniref:MarR family winged helix-turn-helix transcriptional regulator n=1 Tax=Hydrogenophaga sp. TaxID=1904254 RepID=UPI000A8B58A9|nr:MarR family transcriptional regulator [Hydrogenophaga sp.]HAX19430.1 MarR family transcriptional regulator [Hydrogenophaga sp.]HBU17747.1 MarR family transcriptional regulator [Hydrogenophaga sp.]
MNIKSKDTQTLLKHWRESVPNDRLAHLIRDVARAQMRALQYRLIPFGVSFGHWTFLRILWIRDGLTQKELSDLAGVMEPTTFSAMKAMERMGFIERRHLPGNRKNMHVYLTNAGRALEGNLVPLAEQVNQISVEGLPDRSLSMVRNALVQMIENLATEEETRTDAHTDADI